MTALTDRRRAWRAAHPEKVREYSSRYYHAHKEARSIAYKAWCAAHPEKMEEYKAKERLRARHKSAERSVYQKERYETPRGRAVTMLQTARTRAVKLGLEFDLTLDWLLAKVERAQCEVTGVALSMERRGAHRKNPWAPSIDRIKTGGDYTQANCRIVCWAFNMARNDFDEADFAVMARAYVAQLDRDSR